VTTRLNFAAASGPCLSNEGSGRLSSFSKTFRRKKSSVPYTVSGRLQEVMTDFWFNHFNIFLG